MKTIGDTEVIEVDTDECLRLINRGRIAVGDDPIYELPRGYLGIKETCVIAQALPFDCQVTYLDLKESTAMVSVPTAEMIQALTKTWKTNIGLSKKGAVGVVLPEPLYKLMLKFDAKGLPELVATEPADDVQEKGEQHEKSELVAA